MENPSNRKIPEQKKRLTRRNCSNFEKGGGGVVENETDVIDDTYLNLNINKKLESYIFNELSIGLSKHKKEVKEQKNKN